MPGRYWVEGFIERQKISLHSSTNICRGRAAINRNVILPYYRNLAISFKSLFDDIKRLPASQIFNYDETNFTNDPGRKKVLVPRGFGRVELVQDHTKTSVSLMFCGSASGFVLPPMIIYKAENLWDGWTTGGIPGAVYSQTPSGWFNSQKFLEWFREDFLVQTRYIPGP